MTRPQRQLKAQSGWDSETVGAPQCTALSQLSVRSSVPHAPQPSLPAPGGQASSRKPGGTSRHRLPSCFYPELDPTRASNRAGGPLILPTLLTLKPKPKPKLLHGIKSKSCISVPVSERPAVGHPQGSSAKEGNDSRLGCVLALGGPGEMTGVRTRAAVTCVVTPRGGDTTITIVFRALSLAVAMGPAANGALTCF